MQNKYDLTIKQSALSIFIFVGLLLIVSACQPLPDGTTLDGSPVNGLSGPKAVVPVVQINTNNFSEDENIGSATMDIRLNEVTTTVVSVNYTFSGSATSGLDYSNVNGVAIFNPGETLKTVTLLITDDTLDEDDETLTMTISNPVNAKLGSITSSTLTIQDNDLPPSVAFDSATSSGYERNTAPSSINVSLSAASGKIVQVDYADALTGTATLTTDYSFTPGTLTFNPGETTKSISPVTPVDDRALETAGETVELYLSSPSNATLGVQSTNTFTILDDIIGPKLGHFTGTQTTNSTNLNQSTAYAIQWSDSHFDSSYWNHSTTVNSHVITVQAAGDYFLSLTLPLTGAITRGSIQAEVRVNGSAIPGAISESSYIRNSDGHIESSDHITILLEGLAINDTIEVFVKQAAAAGTITVYEQASLYLEYVSPSRTFFKATTNATTGAANLNTASPLALQWSEGREDTGFTHDDVTNPHLISLASAGEYLVSVNLPIVSTVQRANLLLKVKIDDVTVAGGTASQGYIRALSGHNQASLHWSGLVSIGSSGNLSVTVEQEALAGTVNVTSGKVGSLTIEKIDSSSNVYFARGSALSGGTNWNPATIDTVDWTTDTIVDSNVFTHSTTINSFQVTLNDAGDYLLYYNDLLTSSLQRPSVRIQVAVNGVVEPGAVTSSHYIRMASGHTDSSGTMTLLIRDVVAGDTISITAIQEALAGTVDDIDDALLMIWKK